jgi:uncharacterized surface protein with fasciclin (FAS1) repeats
MPKCLPGVFILLPVTASGCVPSTQADTNVAASAPAPATATGAIPMVGGAAMLPSRTIVQNAANSKDHTTLVQAVQAVGLTDTLASAGPYTVFAPTNAAFDQLPPRTMETLLHPDNRSLLTNILSYHVLSARKTAADMAADIRAGGGTATYMTVSGQRLRARMDGSAIIISDTRGNRSRVTQGDVMQSNGVLHVVDAVLLPG